MGQGPQFLNQECIKVIAWRLSVRIFENAIQLFGGGAESQIDSRGLKGTKPQCFFKALSYSPQFIAAYITEQYVRTHSPFPHVSCGHCCVRWRMWTTPSRPSMYILVSLYILLFIFMCYLLLCFKKKKYRQMGSGYFFHISYFLYILYKV